MGKTRIEGLSDINKVLAALPKSVGRPVLVRFGKKRLEPMRDDAKARAPKDTEELADNIIISQRQGMKGQRKARLADRDAVEVFMGPTQGVNQKAVPEEFGSINNPPHGYMRGAWDAHAGGLLTDIAKDLGEAVDGAAKRHAKRQARRG